MPLSQYLKSALPDGVAYADAVHLCQRLYCTIDGVPADLGPECTKEGLAEAFASLSRTGWVKDLPASPSVRTDIPLHWLEVIRSALTTEGGLDMISQERVMGRVLQSPTQSGGRDV